MKKLLSAIMLIATLLGSTFIESCKPPESTEPKLVGQPGNPRFNLQFTNPDNVDIDLHVIDPYGKEIYWNNPYSASGGELDIDCNCYGCGSGPNENIFWEAGSAPKGTYKFWVEYFEKCGSGSGNSNFTIRVAVNETIKQTYTGSLSENNTRSTVWTWTQN